MMNMYSKEIMMTQSKEKWNLKRGEAIEKEKVLLLRETCAYECRSALLWNPLDCKINLRQFWPRGLGAIPMWIIFMLIFLVPQAPQCVRN